MARATGFNVGVDAHIDPQPHGTNLYVEWDGGNMTFFHSSGRGCKPTGRDDVGIVPYIPSGLHSIQRGCVETVGLRAAGSRPYGGYRTAFHSTGMVETVRLRAAGSRPYGGCGGVCHSLHWVVAWGVCHWAGWGYVMGVYAGVMILVVCVP